MRRRELNTLGVGLLTGLAAAALQASPAPGARLVVVSLLGNQLRVYGQDQATGSRLSSNAMQLLNIPGQGFDQACLEAIDTRLQKDQPKLPAELFLMDPSTGYAELGQISADGSIRLHDLIVKALRDAKATHLLVVARRRADADFQLKDLAVGTGRVEGLGFAIDTHTGVRQTDTGEVGTGFLAPFLYANVAVVDAQTLKVVAQVPIEASTTVAATRAKNSSHPWDALSPQEKMQSLLKLVGERVPDASMAALRQAGVIR